VPSAAPEIETRILRNGRELELENSSPNPVEIEVRAPPLQYLNLVVVGPGGQVVSESFYRNLFSPLAGPYTFRLRPGQKYTGPVSLLGNVPRQKWQPGCSTVRAVYAYRDLHASSEPIDIHLEESDCR
jgi:hypothetical protein